MGFSGGSDGKESTCSAGHLGLIPGLRRSPGGGHGNPLQYSCLENPDGQRSLAGYSPFGRKEADMTEQLIHTHTHTHTHIVFHIFSIIVFHRILNIVPCAIQLRPRCLSILHITVCIC